MSIVDLTNDLLPFMELGADDSFGNVARVQAGVEEYFKKYTLREWESADFKEEFTPNNKCSIFVKNNPITKITKVAIGTDTALTITNTNTSTSAIVNVSTAGVVLTYNGADTAGDYTFSTNTTISALVTAINGAGSGWSATAISGFESYLSTELIPRFGAEAINSTSVEIQLPSQALSDFDVTADTGEIYRADGFYYGLHTTFNSVSGSKIFVNYTGGYLTADMPEDVKYAIEIMVSYIYKELIGGRFGVEQCSVAGITSIFTEDGIPKEALDIMKMRRKIRL